MSERDETIDKARELREKISGMSLADFKVEDLPALLGLLGLIDGITSPMHPSERDIETIEKRLEENNQNSETNTTP